MNGRIERVLVDQHGRFNDDCTSVIQTENSEFCSFHLSHARAGEISWLNEMIKLETITQEIITEVLTGNPDSEGAIVP